MTVVLYDLCGAADRRFSPFCWRARMALAHKGLDHEARPVRFTDIPGILDGAHKTVPIIEDGGNIVRESFDIALYLERTYPDRPTLFGGDAGIAAARFFDAWVGTTVNAGLIRLVLMDIHDCLEEGDQAYFRESREKRFAGALESVQEGREDRLDAFRASLVPVRIALKRLPFLGGEGPLYTDFILFGSLQWARVVSDFPILAEDDPIQDWFSRMLDLYGGIGRAQKAAA